ncbi:HesA/MoeB/ThiF family protein [Roseospirillum parvum]|uniref:Molybdopterin-synthase adenylyltransferase n=1 Tax=Roseospirillum parvum TaxID=83401 RepID=A0A1G8DF84_9PROT|nr:molybdopterin-synthase adenylyltransferase MoeB [Roseospirillum parvum]SDH56332.1 adenylyltransferase and sulfurtransferase [Roseospirillum parvum]
MPLTEDHIQRYARHILLPGVGGVGQEKLLAARVLIVGAGGLGSALTLYLAAAGVGTLLVADDDVVEPSNLQRQVLHNQSRLGQNKAESAAQTVAALTPDVTVRPIPHRLDATTAPDLIDSVDVVADGCDNFTTRLLVGDLCHRQGKTLVSAAVRQFDGQLATFKPDGPCYRCLVPEEPPPGGNASCTDAGILGSVAGTLGTLQATEVIKELLGLGESMAGRLLIYDGLNTQTRTITLPKDPHCPTCGTPAA